VFWRYPKTGRTEDIRNGIPQKGEVLEEAQRNEILTVKWGYVTGCVVSCTTTMRKIKLFHFKVKLLNMPESLCKMTLQV
jgi:hypothetical protein